VQLKPYYAIQIIVQKPKNNIPPFPFNFPKVPMAAIWSVSTYILPKIGKIVYNLKAERLVRLGY